MYEVKELVTAMKELVKFGETKTGFPSGAGELHQSILGQWSMGQVWMIKFCQNGCFLLGPIDGWVWLETLVGRQEATGNPEQTRKQCYEVWLLMSMPPSIRVGTVIWVNPRSLSSLISM